MAGRIENPVGNLTLQDQMETRLLVIYASLYFTLLDLMFNDVQSHMKVCKQHMKNQKRKIGQKMQMKCVTYTRGSTNE